MKVQSQFIEMFGNPVTNPKGWKTSKIKDVAPESPSKESVDGRVWLLNLDMIESNTGKVIEKVYEDNENALSVQPFDEGNVLFSKLRPYLNKVVIPDEPGLATTELVPLRPKGDILNKIFFSHLLRGDQFVNFANDIAGGTKMPRMPLSELRKFECILPPMEEQMKFVAIAELADKSKFVGFKSQFIEMFKGCKMIPLKKVACFSKASINPIEGVKYTLFSFPAFDNNCIPEIVDGGEIKSSKLKLEENVILYNKLNVRLSRVWNINELSSNNNVCSSEFLPIKVVNKDLITKSFLYRILCSEDVTKKMVACSTGTSNSQKRISPASLLSLDIPIPSMDEQMKFVAIAEQADKSKYYYQIA